MHIANVPIANASANEPPVLRFDKKTTREQMMGIVENVSKLFID